MYLTQRVFSNDNMFEPVKSYILLYAQPKYYLVLNLFGFITKDTVFGMSNTQFFI